MHGSSMVHGSSSSMAGSLYFAGSHVENGFHTCSPSIPSFSALYHLFAPVLFSQVLWSRSSLFLIVAVLGGRLIPFANPLRSSSFLFPQEATR